MKMMCSYRKSLLILFISLFLTTSLFAGSLMDVRATIAPVLQSPSNGALLTDNTPTASWTPVTMATEYHIQIALKDDFSSILGEDYTTVTFYTASPSLPDGLYYWRVRANAPSTGGWSGWSTVWSFTIDTVAPAAPNVITPEHYGYINYDTPYVEWVRDLSALKYRVEFDDTWDYSSPLNTKNTYNWDYTYPTALADGRYYVRVRSEDSAGNIGPWTEVPFDIDTVPPLAPVLSNPTEGAVITSATYTFEWIKDTGCYFWYLEFSRVSDFSTTTYTVGTSSPDDYTCTPGTSNGVYYWRVRQKDQAENLSPWSAIGSYTLDTVGPSAPGLVAPSNLFYTADTTPYLDWNSGGDAVEYQVMLDTIDTFPSPDIDITTSNTYYTTSTLSEGTYYWRVRGKDPYGNWGGWSSVYSFTVDTTNPSAPALITPENNLEINDNTPYFDWLDVGETASYHIQIDTSDSFPSPTIDVGGLGDSYYQILSSLTDDVYYWRVRAVDLASNVGDWSAIRSFIIDTVGPNAPLLVSPDDAEILTDTTPLLLWNSVTDGEEYQLQLDTAGTFVSFEYNITTTNTFYAIPVDLSDGTYYWRIRARDTAANWGSWSTIWSFTIDLEGPDAPVLNTPSNAGIIDDDTPYLEWIAVGDVVEYEIELASTAVFGGTLLFSTTISDNNYTIFFTLSDDVYYWRVRAKDAAENWGNWSEVWSFKVDTVGPYVVSPEDIEYEIGMTGNNFSWYPQDDNPSSYIVYLEGVVLFSGIWNTSGEEIFIDVDGFGIGTYNFTLYFEDATGKSNIDTVFVTVTEVVISEFSLTVPLILLPFIFIGILIIRKRRK